MITTLTATTTDAVQSALLAEADGRGSSRVLTLIVPTDEAGLGEALAAAHGASRDHPCRVIAVVRDTDHQADAGHAGAHTQADPRGHLDAEIRVGHDAGAGETLVLRPHGEAAGHADTLVVPFLLPDVPVVTWWPTRLPAVPSEDPLGALASYRITNTPAAPDSSPALERLVPVSVSGDIDLAWTRITLWRALVASVLGGPARQGAITSIEVAGEPGNASMVLMVAWLRLRLTGPLGIAVSSREEEGALGIGTITAHTDEGDLAITRFDAERVTIRRPGREGPQVVTMARREPIHTLNEELRRLAPDLVYGEVLGSLRTPEPQE